MTKYTDLSKKIVKTFGKNARIVYSWWHDEDCPAEYEEDAPCLGEKCFYHADPELLTGTDALGVPVWLEVESKKDYRELALEIIRDLRPVAKLPPQEDLDAAVVAYQKQREYDRVEDPVEDQVMAMVEISDFSEF